MRCSSARVNALIHFIAAPPPLSTSGGYAELIVGVVEVVIFITYFVIVAFAVFSEDFLLIIIVDWINRSHR
jgi:hypothetical protein